MKVKEVAMILNDSKMQERQCNFKITDKKSGVELILERLDRIDKRLDNIVKLNHLKE